MKFSDIIHDADLQQFRMEIDGHISKIDYTKRNGRLHLVHSEVPYELRGQGIGKVLTEKTFEYIQDHKLEATAVCSFIKTVAIRSPKWREVIG